MEAHDPFDEDQVRIARGAVQQISAVTQASHPEIELVDRVPRGALENHGIDEVGPGLEDPHTLSAASGEAGEGGGDRGLPLSRSWGGNQQRTS
jgi:hypothetical protein